MLIRDVCNKPGFPRVYLIKAVSKAVSALLPLGTLCPSHLLPFPVLLNHYVHLQPPNQTVLTGAVVASCHYCLSLVKINILGCCDLHGIKRNISAQKWSQAEPTTLGKEAKVEK